MTAASSQQLRSIESTATTIANEHNAKAASMIDDMTVSTRAVAIGKNVRFDNVLRVKKGLPREDLDRFQQQLTKEIVPRICDANAKSVAFKKGLYYTFTYRNEYGERLAKFDVDAAACGIKP